MQYETVEVPFRTSGNVQYLTDKQLCEHFWLWDFIEQFRDCFQYDAEQCVWWYYPVDT